MQPIWNNCSFILVQALFNFCYSFIDLFKTFKIGEVDVRRRFVGGKFSTTSVNTLFGDRTQLQTTITVVGRDSGARITIPVTITKTN